MSQWEFLCPRCDKQIFHVKEQPIEGYAMGDTFYPDGEQIPCSSPPSCEGCGYSVAGFMFRACSMQEVV